MITITCHFLEPFIQRDEVNVTVSFTQAQVEKNSHVQQEFICVIASFIKTKTLKMSLIK